MKNSKVNLAIISPSKNAYSETFIQAHRKLDANVLFYYGGFLPLYLEGSGRIYYESARYGWYLIKNKFIRKSKFSFHEICLINSFKRNRVQLVLAEYGPSGAEVLNVCRELRLPLIVHFHGYDASERATLSTYHEQYQELFQYASHVISVSEKMNTDLINLGCPKDKITFNTYGPDPEFFKIERAVSENQFVSIGRFVDKKAPQLTIAAFKEVVSDFPDAKLIMGGDGYLLPVCKQLVQLWGLEKNVVFRGAVRSDEVMLLFSQSLAFLQHSIIADSGDSEGTPVVVLEAGAAGLPVIATRHAGIRDVVIDKVTGFLFYELYVMSKAALSKRCVATVENVEI